MGMKRTVFLLLCLAAVASAAPIQVTWFPQNGVFRVWDDPGLFSLSPLGPGSGAAAIRHWEVALRDRNKGRTCRIDYPAPDVVRENGWNSWGKPLPPAPLAALRALGEGTFDAALVADGKRCSNIVTFSIRADYDITREPVVRLVPVRALPGEGIVQFGVWVVPPSPQDTRLTNMAAAFPELEYDGIWHQPRSMAWAGPVGPLAPGKAYATTHRFADYVPDIASAPQGPCRVRIVMPHAFTTSPVQPPSREYVSPSIVLASDRSDDQEFDRAFGLR